MTEPDPDHFEMRRLEQLSDTIFGVAMTLLAYDLPRAAQFANPPGWAELYQLYRQRLVALALSFIIAGVFWVSHHHRLARQPYASRAVVFINLLFLLSIILLPVINGLYGAYGQSSVVAVLYGLHLSAIAALNGWLWWIATRDQRPRPELVRSLAPLLAPLPGTAVAAIAPQYTQYLWLLAFGALAMRRSFGGRGAA